MRMITINVDEDVYRRIQTQALRRGTSASELIREAMHRYDTEELQPARSIFEDEPVRVGTIHHDLGAEDDLLDEMLS